MPAAIFDAMEATWPPARRTHLSPFTLRDGQGGGKRVSAATADGPAEAGDIDAAAAAMGAMGQPALFRLDDGGGALDPMLAAAGYALVDPTLARTCDIGALLGDIPPPVSGFTIWPPLGIMNDIWAEGGIGAGRLAVMDRVKGPKTGLLGRIDDKPAAVGFIALHGDIAMVHALEVRPSLRRRGMAATLMRHGAIWAAARGARTMAVLVTEANVGANALYGGLGMEVRTRYHYRLQGDNA